MRKKLLYIILGVIALVLVVVGIGAFLILPAITSASANQTPTPTPSTTAMTTATPKANSPAKVLKQYAPDIKNQIAQGLHLAPDQLTTQLQSGKTLTDAATAQHVSASQLQTIVSNAIETSLKPAVADGTLTQKQVDKLAKKYSANPVLLDHLLGGKASQ